MSNIEDVVKSHIIFSNGVANNGWHKVYCEVCGDGKRTKGPRGGWLFQDDIAFYHCFNCGVDGSFDPNREQCFSKDMKNIFEKFGIPIDECKKLCISSLKTKSAPKVNTNNTIKILETPDHFVRVNEISSDTKEFINDFLKSHYGLNINSYPFFVSNGITHTDDVKEKTTVKFWLNRLIIPFYKNGNLIYYKGRDLTNTSRVKYLAPNIPKTNILFNVDELYKNTQFPLFIVESEFDAINLNGCAVMENKISNSQAILLNKSPRKKIIIPDFNGDSSGLVDDAIANGWSVSVPDFGSCKDVSEAVVNYGKLFVLRSIMNSIYEGKYAKIVASIKN